MPPQKSPRPKKANSVAKPKGAVRAKSGCYTCRIRRKKCDEKRIGEEGPCETCFRLKLECLGFGAKRPDWLRESSRVSAIRDKIKAHLAAQGMIKGHSGSGSRSAIQEDFLRLSEFRDSDAAYPSGSSTSESPHPRDISEESDRPSYSLSFPPATATLRGQYEIHSPDYMYPHDDLRSSRCVSPSGSMMHHSQFPEYDDPMSSVNSFTHELTPALRSLFSQRNLYHIPDAEWGLEEEYDFDFVNQHSRGTPTIPAVYPSNLVPREVVNDSLREYVNNIVKIQYLLGDNTILPSMIWEAIKVHEESREAVNLLSQIYSKRRQDPQRQVLLCDIPFKARVEELQATLSATARLASSADDAMAALHVVSLFLFDGGQGAWNIFLSIASTYVLALLENPRYHRNYSAALQACGPKDEFIVKTTIWFDVLGSITMQEQPRLLSAIRELFDPNRSYIGGNPSYSMLSPMGCENVVVWALAEASSLSCWKRKNKRKGTLSHRELVHKAEEIEIHLDPQIPLPQPPPESHEDWSRLLASRIFRSATKLFLQSIVNGDHPRVPELQKCANETFDCITNFPHPVSKNKPAIVRSTVFGIFLCGSLTNDQNKRHRLSLLLQQESGADGVGNTSTVVDLLNQIWETRKTSPKSSVPWRELLKEAQILLV